MSLPVAQFMGAIYKNVVKKFKIIIILLVILPGSG